MPSEHRPSSDEGGGVYDPIANAVFSDIAHSNVPVFTIRLMPTAPNAPEPVFILWLIGGGRFCLTVRPGRHVLLKDAWHLETGASLQRIPSPLAQAWDEVLLTSRAIHRKLRRRVMIAPAVAFPDTAPDARIQRVAQRSRVVVMWDLDGLTRLLVDAAASDPQRNPPTREQAEEEVAALADPNTPPTGPPI